MKRLTRDRAGFLPWQRQLFRLGITTMAISWVVGVLGITATFTVSHHLWPIIALACAGFLLGAIGVGTVMISTVWTDD